MNEIIMNKTDELVMKLLHYFIVEKEYTPIILHGVQNEIWLENLGEDYKIIRIVSNYIHNDEQFKYDLFKTGHVMKKIKRKTCSFDINALSIFVNLGENVKQIREKQKYNKISCIELNDMDDLNKSDLIKQNFPKIMEETNFKEKGAELFMKLTMDINKKSEEEAKKNESIFTKKRPVLTLLFLFINTLIFLFVHLNPNLLDHTVLANKTYLNKEYYRLIISFFTHYSFFHFLFTSYALYVIGSQLESFIGKTKFAFVYLASGIAGNLFQMAFLGENEFALGSSGAIFGLLGSLLYFGYYYRVYLGTIVRSQIIPLIVFNLLLGFIVPGVANIAHIGGLIAGILATMAVGIKYKTTTFEKINSFIVLGIYFAFLSYLAFIGI